MMVVYGIEINDLNRGHYVKMVEAAVESVSLPGECLVDLIPICEDF